MHKKNTNLSKFQLSNEVKTSFEIGQVIPFYWRDTVPGDIWRNNTNLTIRFMPLVAPVMHKLDIHCHFYFTPYRLLDKNFKDILAKPESPLVSKSLADLRLSTKDPILERNNLLRAFGIHSKDGTLPLEAQKLTSQYFLRAYHLIYNYYYKHEILDDSYIDDMNSDDLDAMGHDLLNIGYARHGFDYFMSNLPNTQYGSMVELDMDGNSQIRVDEMRLAEKLQYFKEQLFTRARGRYKQFLDTFFGVSPTNYELQIPKYLGGGSQTLAVADIDQTANYSIDNQSSPLGSQAGKINNDKFGFDFKYKTEEHGLILGLCYVLPRASYVGGIPREFIKPDFYSFYNPTFANLGMQETYGMELSADRLDTFGYNERYAELKNSKDVIAGDFANLTSWHFGIDLRDEQLSKDFVHVKTDNTPFAVESFLVEPTNFGTLFEWKILVYKCDNTNNPDGVPYRYYIVYVKYHTYNIDTIKQQIGEQISRKMNFSSYEVDIFEINNSLHDPILPNPNSGTLRLSLDSDINSDVTLLPKELPNVTDYYSYVIFHGSLVSNTDNVYFNYLQDMDYNNLGFWPELFNPVTFNGTDIISYGSDNQNVLGNHILLVAYNDCDALRPIPKLAKPSIMI